MKAKRPVHVSDFETEVSLFDADRQEYNKHSDNAYWRAYLEKCDRKFWEKRVK